MRQGVLTFARSTKTNRTPPQNEKQNEKRRKTEENKEEDASGKEITLNDIYCILKTIQNENKDIKEEIEGIRKEMQEEREQREELINRIGYLEDRVDRLETRLSSKENFERRANIIMRGVKEENEEDTNELVSNILREKLKIEIHEIEVDRTERLGRKREDGVGRPILIKTKDVRDKVKIMKKRSLLKGTKIFLDDDFCSDTMRKRKRIMQLAREMKIPRKDFRLIGEKIRIENKDYILSTEDGKDVFIETKN